MYIDTVVIAGICTVLLMFAFFGGVGMFIWKDSHKRK
ncbi:cytochrome c oxidase subunit CcoM [Pseudomonas sp. NPDC078700]